MNYTNSNIFEQNLNLEKAKFDKYIKDYFDDKKSHLNLSNEQNLLFEAMQYSVINGGKRFRPALLSDVCKRLNGDEELAVEPALALEFIHCFSLIHDDLPCMDDDDMRRGLPACHKKFGESTALLAGCSLMSLAFDMVLKSKLSTESKLETMRILSDSCGLNGLCGGQIMDILTNKDEQNLVKIAKLKTGTLFEASIQIGIICAKNKNNNIDTNVVEKLTDIGVKFSFIYQLVDDILDVISPTTDLGKPNGSDFKSGKRTFVDIYGTTEAKNKAEKQILELIEVCEFNNFHYILYICKYLLYEISKYEV